MKQYKNALLTGVAALALVAGTGLASAQQSKEHIGGTQAGSPRAGQSMSQGTQTQAQEKTKGAHTQAQEKAKGTQNQAQTKSKAKTDRTAKTGKEEMKPSGQESRGARAEHVNRGSKSTRQAERKNTLKGLQGNAAKPMRGEDKESSKSTTKDNSSNHAKQQERGNNSTETNEGSAQLRGSGTETQGGNVKLSEQQRTQIKDTVINGRNAPRVGHVDFNVRIGTVIPRGSIHVTTVPETLVRIEPRWRGNLYFVYEDEVVIVNPHDYRIVAVVPV